MNLSIQDGGYLTASQVRARYGGRSDMWLWRRKQDPGFPKPIKIGKQRLWRAADLIAYEQGRLADATTQY